MMRSFSWFSVKTTNPPYLAYISFYAQNWSDEQGTSYGNISGILSKKILVGKNIVITHFLSRKFRLKKSFKSKKKVLGLRITFIIQFYTEKNKYHLLDQLARIYEKMLNRVLPGAAKYWYIDSTTSWWSLNLKTKSCHCVVADGDCSHCKGCYLCKIRIVYKGQCGKVFIVGLQGLTGF